MRLSLLSESSNISKLQEFISQENYDKLSRLIEDVGVGNFKFVFAKQSACIRDTVYISKPALKYGFFVLLHELGHAVRLNKSRMIVNYWLMKDPSGQPIDGETAVDKILEEEEWATNFSVQKLAEYNLPGRRIGGGYPRDFVVNFMKSMHQRGIETIEEFEDYCINLVQ